MKLNHLDDQISMLETQYFIARQNTQQQGICFEKINRTALKKAQFFFLQKKLPQAYKWLLYVLKNNPENKQAQKQFTRLLYMNRRYQQVDSVLQEAWRISSALQIKLVELCSQYYSKKLYERALCFACKLLKIQPECIECLRVCNQTPKYISRFRAIEIINQELKIRGPLRYLNLWVRGIIEQQSKNFDKSEKFYQLSIKAKYTFYLAFHSLFTLLKKEKKQHKITDYLRLVPQLNYKLEISSDVYVKDYIQCQPSILILANLLQKYTILSLAIQVYIYYLRTITILNPDNQSQNTFIVCSSIASNYLNLNLWKQANFWALRAITKLPKQYEPQYLKNYINSILAVSYCMQSCNSLAQDIVNQVLLNIKISIDACQYIYAHIIIVFYMLKKPKKVIEIYEKYREIMNQQDEYPVKIYAILAYRDINNYDCCAALYYPVIKTLKQQNYANINFLTYNSIYRLIDFCFSIKHFENCNYLINLSKNMLKELQIYNGNILHELKAQNKIYQGQFEDLEEKLIDGQ